MSQPNDIRARAIELRRTHTLREVATTLGVPVGTVKTWCSRSGAFRDNEALRALMTLPPVQHSEARAVTVAPELPAQEAVTGNPEVDAVLWLRAVVETGDSGHIAKALEAFERIKTPPKELELAYGSWLVKTTGNTMTAVFESMRFADLEGHAQSILQRNEERAAALARFGTVEELFADTPAEAFCIDALDGVELDDRDAVRERFEARPEFMPHTLSDCLHELAFWLDLYRVRNPFGALDPGGPEASAREDFVFGLMARIRPRSKDEAVAVLRHLGEHEVMDRDETEGILENLVGN